MGEIRHPVGAHECQLAILEDHGDRAGPVVAVPRAHELVEPLRGVDGDRL